MIVGTAGHIDHGKTALVRALTGVDTDRLKEEKARGISIDLGFAYMPIGDGQILGFVDVPGHERFVRNMLAGATGIDAVLLVVAADDGVMPQTREHLAIVDLLGVSRGIVALTKSDLASAEWLDAVEEDLRQTLQPTGLADAEIIRVSTATGQGIEALRERLHAEARAFRARDGEGRFRLAVDRCFTITGAGTVVTGVVMSGEVKVGDSVLVSPCGLKARVRSIHAQNRPAERGAAGERCALNLVGEDIGTGAIERGDIVLDPGLHAPADRIDASLRLLASERRPLAHWTPVRLHHAASETSARVALLDEAPIAPGAEGRIQLALDRPIAASAGDRFILRTASGSRTIGGGRFIDLRAPHRRRRAPARLEQLDALAIEEPGPALAALLERWPFFADVAAFARDRALSETQVKAALTGVPLRQVPAGEGSVLVSPMTWRRLEESARATLAAFHGAHPELPGLPASRLSAALEPRLPPRISAAVVQALVEQGALILEGGAVRTPEHRFGLDPGDERLWARISPLLSGEERFRPPRANEIAPLVKAPEAEVRRVLKALARRRDVIEVAPDHFFRRETVDEMAHIAADVARGQTGGQFSAAQLRDRLDNGRKVAIQVLEYFDRRGVTLRRGDLRRINPSRLGQFASPTAARLEGD
jgi:selenocysteine-specific elongation factor